MILLAYHGNCTDGFTAAWSVQRWMKCHTVAMHYTPESEKELINVMKDYESLIVVDFSLTLETLSALQDKKVNIFDHHKTAFERYAPWHTVRDDSALQIHLDRVYIHLEQDRSGCGIAWDPQRKEKYTPWLIRYVQDYDLWKFEFGDDTRAINLVLRSLPRTFETWEDTHIELETGEHERVLEKGHRLLSEFNREVKALAATATPVELRGENKGWRVACEPRFASSVGNAVAKEKGTFCLLVLPKRNMSLRSYGHLDVSAIAKLYGGGGHKNAAGFNLAEGERL